MDLNKLIIDVKDFPIQGVVFKDITPLLESPKEYKYVIDEMISYARQLGVTTVIAPEARGFLFAPAVCYGGNLKFVIARKPGKLPREVSKATYDLEYGTNTLEINADSLNANDKILIIDDILATGGTVKSIVKLAQQKNAEVKGAMFLGDLVDLHKKDVLGKIPYKALLNF